LAAIVVLAVGPTSAAAAQTDPPRITIAVVPDGITVPDLAGVAGMGVGLMSAGIGPVPADQTYLDVGQGNRIAPVLYDDPLPPLEDWPALRKRAADAPADIVPGLLGQTLGNAALPVRAG